MVLSSGLGYVNFINGDGENWRVRCGWMYYTEKRPEYGLKRSKMPPYRHVKKSAISYDGRILWGLGLIRQD